MEGAALIFMVGLIILGIMILVWVLRWALRIDHICTRLDQIAAVAQTLRYEADATPPERLEAPPAARPGSAPSMNK